MVRSNNSCPDRLKRLSNYYYFDLLINVWHKISEKTMMFEKQNILNYFDVQNNNCIFTYYVLSMVVVTGISCLI